MLSPTGHGPKDPGNNTPMPNLSQRESSLPQACSATDPAYHSSPETKPSRTQDCDSSSLEMVLIGAGDDGSTCSGPCWIEEEGTGI